MVSTTQMESSKHGEFNTLIFEDIFSYTCVVLSEMRIFKFNSFIYISFSKKHFEFYLENWNERSWI